VSVRERAIYSFPSGELLPEHCAAFGRAICGVITRPDAPISVVLALGSVPDAVPPLGADRYDATLDCALLDYASRDKLLASLWPLFMGAEPELFFAHADAFEDVLARVAAYGEAILALRQARSDQSIWQRMRTPAPRFSLEHTALVQAYAPVIVHRPDGVCSALEAS
jgi:hypothetical protein